MCVTKTRIMELAEKATRYVLGSLGIFITRPHTYIFAKNVPSCIYIYIDFC